MGTRGRSELRFLRVPVCPVLPTSSVFSPESHGRGRSTLGIATEAELNLSLALLGFELLCQRGQRNLLGNPGGG